MPDRSGRPLTPTQRAVRVLALEAAGILRIGERLGEEFTTAVRLLEDCRGKVIATGIGKSGLIARKIAATLASTGTPACFLHPADALHGDVGMLSRGDIALVVSNSGETAEILQLIPSFLALDIRAIALTGNLDSSLARYADAVLDVGVLQEACPLGLAPTASTTAALAMGDALAVVLYERRGFSAEDFARLHPGGMLGSAPRMRL